MEFTESGIWITNSGSDHATDKRLAKAFCSYHKVLLKRLKSDNLCVLDIGAGLGQYTLHMRQNGVQALAFDGNEHLKKNVVDAMIGDLTKPIDLPEFHFGLCLEVMNHIPESLMIPALMNIRNSSLSHLIMSWAVPGQGGPNQLNYKTPSEVIKIMKGLGYTYLVDDSSILKLECDFPWLSNSLSVFQVI